MVIYEPITFGDKTSELNKTEGITSSIINTSFFENDDTVLDNDGTTTVSSTKSTKMHTKRKNKKKETKTIGNDEVITGSDNNNELNILENNDSYSSTYEETQGILKETVGELSMLGKEINGELQQVIASRTLKKKYDYVSLLAGALASIHNNKISAVREINKTITDGHNLDFKKFKELKLAAANEKDDNKNIMEMYKAFISTPTGTYNAPAMASPVDITSIDMNNVQRADIITDNQAYIDNYNSLTPVDNMMLLENNPDIKTVVILDDVTGAMSFDVVNIKTGESVPNTEKPDPMFLDDINIDRFNGVATNRNIKATYPLIIINENKALSQY